MNYISKQILVGQKGYKHSGSGGTFVVMMFEKYTKNLLLVAGAGGSSNSPIPNLSVSLIKQYKTYCTIVSLLIVFKFSFTESTIKLADFRIKQNFNYQHLVVELN